MHPHGFHSPPPHPPPGWGGGHHPSHHGHHHHPPQGPPPSVGEFLPHHRHYQPPPGPPPPSLREQSPHHRHYQPPPGPPPPSVREHSPAGQYQPPPGPPPPSVGGYPSRPTTHPLYNENSTPPHRPQSLPPQPHRVNTLPPTSTPPVPVRHSPVPPQSSPAPSYHMRSHPPPYASLPPTPPQSPQSFGHGAPSSYQFQYSNCSGKRKALLIGINYFGQANQLKGCINDVTQMSTFLNQVYGYRREDMVILTDDQQNPLSQPTKANIIRAMHWLVKDAMPNDSLFVHFSGHGGRTPDLDGDEDDGFDDVIYPVDYKNAGHIVDDDMHDIMVKPLQPGVRLTAIFDSCHSGTALDLPFIYSTQGVLKEPNLAKEAAQDLFSAFSAYGKGDISGVAQTAIGFFKKATIGGSARERRMMTKTSPADVVMFSGSKDTQTSADTFQGGQARGALSWAFIETLKQYPKQSYLQLLNNIRAKLERNYSQKPQLSCSHPLGL